MSFLTESALGAETGTLRLLKLVMTEMTLKEMGAVFAQLRVGILAIRMKYFYQFALGAEMSMWEGMSYVMTEQMMVKGVQQDA